LRNRDPRRHTGDGQSATRTVTIALCDLTAPLECFVGADKGCDSRMRQGQTSRLAARFAIEV